MRSHLITRALVAFTIVLGLAFGSTGAFAAAKKGGKSVGQGETCGTIVGITCNKGLFCQNAPGQCKGADLAGKCEVIPQICTDDVRPVCGCNGKTYSNDCRRQQARAQLAHEGPCEKKKY